MKNPGTVRFNPDCPVVISLVDGVRGQGSGVGVDVDFTTDTHCSGPRGPLRATPHSYQTITVNNNCQQT